MEIQLRCDQVESVKLESINVEPETLGGGEPVTVTTGTGRTSFTAARVSLCSFNGQPCQHPPSRLAHGPPPTQLLKICQNLCVGEPHTHTHTPSPKSLMEPVKTTSRSLAASLILSPNYC